MLVKIPNEEEYVLWVDTQSIVEVQVCGDKDETEYWYVEIKYIDADTGQIEVETTTTYEVKELAISAAVEFVRSVNKLESSK